MISRCLHHSIILFTFFDNVSIVVRPVYIKMAQYCFKVKSTKNEQMSRFDKCFENIERQLASINLTNSQADEIVELSLQLLNANKIICTKLLEERPGNAFKILEDAYNYAHEKFKQLNTAHSTFIQKRKRLDTNGVK